MVHVLIGSGNTHNFLQPALVKKLKLQVQAIRSFKVYIGSGDSLSCSSKCPNLALNLQGTKFELDLFVLPMRGAEIVLGIQWLQQLGRVTHDYAKQSMEFDFGGKPILLKGTDSVNSRRISFHQMNALMQSDEVYGIYELHPFHANNNLEPSKDINLLPNLPSACMQILEKFRALFEEP